MRCAAEEGPKEGEWSEAHSRSGTGGRQADGGGQQERCVKKAGEKASGVRRAAGEGQIVE